MTSLKTLRVLLVASSEDDAVLTLAKLEQSGFTLEHLRVEDAPSLQSALTQTAWDVALCYHKALCYQGTSQFNGFDALALLRSSGVDPACVFLAHDQDEELISRAFNSGAHGVVHLANLNFLVPTVLHAIAEVQTRRENRESNLALQTYQDRLHSFISNLPGMAFQFLHEANGHMSFPYVSEGGRTLLGLEPMALKQDFALLQNILYPNDRAAFQEHINSAVENKALLNWEGRIVMPQNGKIKWINMRGTARVLENGDILWEGIMHNISQSKFAGIGLKQSQDQLRELSSHIQDAREQERLNIARDIHDDMGGTLTAIKIDITWLSGRLDTGNPELISKTKGIEALVDRCINSANNILRTLRPSVLDSFGIIAAIEMEAEEFEKRTGISCPINQIDDGYEISPEASIALFRIFQETLTNIMKHAHATEVTVDIANREDGVDLVICDNGCGLKDVDRLKPRSFGLRGIQERVAHFNGKVQISSKPGNGTTVQVYVPHSLAQSPSGFTSQRMLF